MGTCFMCGSNLDAVSFCERCFFDSCISYSQIIINTVITLSYWVYSQIASSSVVRGIVY